MVIFTASFDGFVGIGLHEVAYGSCDEYGDDGGEWGKEGKGEDREEDEEHAFVFDGFLPEFDNGIEDEDADAGADAGEGVDDDAVLELR